MMATPLLSCPAFMSRWKINNTVPQVLHYPKSYKTLTCGEVSWGAAEEEYGGVEGTYAEADQLPKLAAGTENGGGAALTNSGAVFFRSSSGIGLAT